VFLLRAHKTAGQSFNLSLRRAFRKSEICRNSFSWQYADAEPGDFTRYSYFQGHIGLPTADRIAPGARLVTMLRDPVSRLTSSYFYWRSQSKRVENWSAHEIAKRLSGMTLLEYVTSEDPEIRRSSWNVQARLLAGADYGATPEQRTMLFGCEWDLPELIERALAGMERFAVIGTVDRFDESLALTYQTLELPGEPEVVFDNRTPSKFVDQEVTDEILEHAHRLTEADQVVFEAASQRLAELAGLGSG
jgi:hypothetical protein